jgi:NAD(P)-dependent dehydrogenase (short-subunit alcohol dehydrogenase family)
MTVIVGAGGVLGDALKAEFETHGYEVDGLRRPESCDPRFRSCDLLDGDAVRLGVRCVIEDRSRIDVLICNAAHLQLGSVEQLGLGQFEKAWQCAVASAIGAVQAALSVMRHQRSGCVLFTGATASLRGNTGFAAFASAKFALRGFAQSLAREYQPQGIHVAHVIIDGILRESRSAAAFDVADHRACDPRAVAQSYRWLAEQPPSAWTHELDLRPQSERF